jgi:hypothetical protein
MTDEFDLTCKCGPDSADCFVECVCSCHDELLDRGEQGEEDFATGPDRPARWLNPPRPIGDHDARQ